MSSRTSHICYDTMATMRCEEGRPVEGKIIVFHNQGIGGRECGTLSVYSSIATKENLTFSMRVREHPADIILSLSPKQLRILRERITDKLRESVDTEVFEVL